MVSRIETRGGREPEEQIRSANFHLVIKPERIPWIYAAIANQPIVELYNGEFPEPFTSLSYVVSRTQNEIILTAVLGAGQDFNNRYADSIGSKSDLENPLLHRYPKSDFQSPQLLVIHKDDHTHAFIAREQDDNGNRIIIQMGGKAGKLSLSEENPINDLSRHLIDFNLLVQRYVSTIWKASEETNQQAFQLNLSLLTLPEGAPNTYFSTFSIVGDQFRGRPRPVDLDLEIGGYPQVKAEVKSLVVSLTDPQTSRSHGRQPFSNKFILVSGAEGTGKSLFPKAIDTMLRARGEKYEDFRLPLSDILISYGTYAATIITTILDHIRKNEKNKIPTLLHIDNLEMLVPLSQRSAINRAQASDSYGSIQVSDAEFSSYTQTIYPIIQAFRQFGLDFGGESHYVIIYGESRLPRELLPEGVARTFRRSFNLDKPTKQDIKDILRVQIATTRKFAAPTGHDPFQSDIESKLDEVAISAVGLVGRDIQQVIMDIIAQKISTHTPDHNYSPITAEEIIKEVGDVFRKRGLEEVMKEKRHIGFHLPHKE